MPSSIQPNKVIYIHLKNGTHRLAVNTRTASACWLLCQHRAERPY